MYGRPDDSPFLVHTPHLRDTEYVFNMLRSTVQGLSNSEVVSRLMKVGANKLPATKKPSNLWKFLMQFTEPLVIMLLVSCLVSILISEFADAIGILIAICIVNIVGFVQQQKSEKSAEALKRFVTHQSKVIRGGIQKEIDSTELVPGDIVVLTLGDRVPADLRIFESVDLSIEQEILSGEKKNIYKYSEPMDGDGSEAAWERNNMAYMGTIVTNGNGRGVTVGTGANTEFGRICSSVHNSENEETQTPLQESMSQLAKQLSTIACVVVAIIFLVGALQGKPLLDMFTIAVSLAVAAIPEGLPIVVTVTLALGVTRMSKKRAIIRVLPAVEALGAASVICSDKTGTITKMK